MEKIDKEFKEKLILLLEGIDDYWMTFPENFEIINYFRRCVDVEEIKEWERQNMLDRFDEV